jgi:hypothetical protein
VVEIGGAKYEHIANSFGKRSHGTLNGCCDRGLYCAMKSSNDLRRSVASRKGYVM